MEGKNSYLEELKNSLSETQELLDCLNYRSSLFEQMRDRMNAISASAPQGISTTGGNGWYGLGGSFSEDLTWGYLCKYWDLNEKKILYLKGKSEINTLARVLKEKNDYFDKFSIEFNRRKMEMEVNYTKTLNLAKELQTSNPIIKQHLENTNWEKVESDIEVRVSFYERIKKLTENQ
jgi:hypothetical protein